MGFNNIVAAFAAFSTAFLTLMAIMALVSDFDSVRDFLPITLPSVFTALLSVCTFYKSIRSALNASVPAYIPPQEYIDTE